MFKLDNLFQHPCQNNAMLVIATIVVVLTILPTIMLRAMVIDSWRKARAQEYTHNALLDKLAVHSHLKK